MISKQSFKNLIKECIAEVLAEPSTNVNELDMPHEKWTDTFDKKIPGEFTVEGKKSSEFTSLIKECVMDVLKETLTEGFDPLSQGPNPVEDNPYPQINSRMRKLEEEGDHGRYAQEAGSGQFDPNKFAVNGMSEDQKNDFLAKFGLGEKYVPQKRKLYECPSCKKHNAYHTEEHPDTDMNEMVFKCPDCKYKRSVG
jgi:DNA-directed RNA polymerase subunit RPC12/RpoP